MKNGAISTCALLFSLAATISSAAGGPLLTIESAEFDFGFVPQNSKIIHTFYLRNTGDELLVIDKVIPGCGCTKAPLKKSELIPGETTELEIIFSTKRYHGRVSKRPRIETNEGLSPKNVTIYANVIDRPDATHPIAIKPNMLDMSVSGGTEGDRFTFKMTNISKEVLSPILVDYPVDLMQVRLPETLEPGTGANGEIKLHSEALEMPFEKSITIQLDDREATRFTIPIKRLVSLPGRTVVSSGASSK